MPTVFSIQVHPLSSNAEMLWTFHHDGKGPVQERSWRDAARTVFAAPLCQAASRSSIPFLVHPCLSRLCVFPDGRFFFLYPLQLYSICALFVDLAHRCFPLRPDSPCRGPVFAYERFSIYLMWLGECHALVVDLSFPLLPCKSFGVLYGFCCSDVSMLGWKYMDMFTTQICSRGAC